MRLLSVTRKCQRIFLSLSNFSNENRRLRHVTSVSDFHFPSTCSGRALKFRFSAAILGVISSQTLFFLQFTFLKSFSCSLYWEINSRVSFLLSTASTCSTEHDAIFVYSGNNDVIILAAPGSRIAGMEIQGFRNENSSQTNAYTHYSNYSYSGLIQNERAINLQ